MGTCHVESLTYRLETDDAISFDADPVEYETDVFSLRLEEDELTVDLHEHFSSVEGARECVDPFLEAWEVKYGTQFRRREISFSYEDAEIAREKAEGNVISVEGLEHEMELSGEISLHVERGRYPDPPDKFRLSPDARTLWNRYENYEEGRERLFAMGYACLTILEDRAGSRDEAEEWYNVEDGILGDLGELTSTRGSPEVARKPSSSQGEAIPEERKWIEEAIRKIVLQVGISDAGHDPETLTKDDLPPLP